MSALESLPEIITAIGGVGTAAFGLVDATKAFGGGVNHIGFGGIKRAVTALAPSASAGRPAPGLPPEKIIATLQANWFNGTDLVSQKAIAKTLIKLNLNADNAATVAAATNVNADALAEIAASIAKGAALDVTQADAFARFDLIVTALLDEAYQRADQTYRNWTRVLATGASLVLALAGGAVLHTHRAGGSLMEDILEALLVGLLATPLAPIAKDVSSALSTAVNALQTVKK